MNTTFTLDEFSLWWGRSLADSIRCSGCDTWALGQPLYHVRKAAPCNWRPNRIPVPGQRDASRGAEWVCLRGCTMCVCCTKRGTGALTDTPAVWVVLKWSKQMQMQGCFRDHKGAKESTAIWVQRVWLQFHVLRYDFPDSNQFDQFSKDYILHLSSVRLQIFQRRAPQCSRPVALYP